MRSLDIAALIDAEIITRIRQALCEHGVFVFHDQHITTEQYVAFSERFSPLEMTIPTDPIGDGGPIGIISNLDDNGAIIPPDDPKSLYTVANTLWRSDGSFRRVPLRGSLLYAKVVPPDGGETEFSSLCAAYAALPSEMKAKIEDLVVEHSMAHSRKEIAENIMPDDFLRDTPPVQQVLVRTIPETGNKSLYVGSYTTRVIGWPTEEGQALLKELLEWTTQSMFVYRHQWSTNDLVVYDNRIVAGRGIVLSTSAYCTVPRWPVMVLPLNRE